MSKLILKTYFLLILLFALSCTNPKKQSEIDSDSTIIIDSSLVKDFLRDPRNSLIMNKLEYETECKLSEKPNSSELRFILCEYYDCEYLNKGKKIAEMKYSVFKTDSTWPLGTNGLQIYRFETDKQTFPLKSGLKVGSTIQDFQEVFGIPKKLKNKYSYDFEFELFSSTLILESKNNTVTKITVANTMYN